MPTAAPRSRTPSPSRTDDPAARWESIRARWLRPPSPSADDLRAAARRERDPVFQERIATLGELLREANGAATSSGAAPPPPRTGGALLVPAMQLRADDGSGAGSSGSRLGIGRAPAVLAKDGDGLDEVPDGGMPIRDAGGNGGQGDPVHELKKVSEGIFLAFKQGRALKEPLPLSLVTSLLFRSWFLDGTIPPNYVPDPEPLASIPAHLHAEMHSSSPASAVPSPLVRPAAPERAPSLLAALSAHSPHAVTPLTSSSGGTSSDPSAPPATPPPAGLAASTLTKPGLHPLQPAGTGLDGSSGGSGTLKLDVLRGSRWRTEKEIASGSDVI